MKKLALLSSLTPMALLIACASASQTPLSDPITHSEAKRLACPTPVLEAGASKEDCQCVEATLYTMGQTPGAIKYDNPAPHEDFGGKDGRREIAIGLLRLTAFEQCGLFDLDHPVSKNL